MFIALLQPPESLLAVPIEEMAEALAEVRQETQAPIAACIYTHFHYVNGTRALQAELKTERKRSQKARDAYRAERDKAEMARQSYTGLAERSAANVENLKAELAEAKDWGKKWKAEHADIVKRLVAEQSCLIDQKQMTKSAREAYEGAKKSVGELSDKLYGTKGALETATKIVEDHEAQINELRETLELANAATNALQQKLDHAETEVTNARIAEQAAHDRLYHLICLNLVSIGGFSYALYI